MPKRLASLNAASLRLGQRCTNDLQILRACLFQNLAHPGEWKSFERFKQTTHQAGSVTDPPMLSKRCACCGT